MAKKLADDLLTTEAAARELDMRVPSVRRAILEGRLRAEKIGPRAWVIRRRDLEAYRAAPKAAGGRPRKAGGGNAPRP